MGEQLVDVHCSSFHNGSALSGLINVRGLCEPRITSNQCAVTRLFIRGKHDSHISSAANDRVEGPKGVPEVPTSAKSSILGNLKKGRGGRSSFSGIVATIFGVSAKGLVAPVLINALGKYEFCLLQLSIISICV